MLYYFLLISLFFNTYSMQFDKINLPLEIFSNTLNCCFRIPTHIEEILEQDKKLFSFRLVCKKWENCFNAVFLMRLNTINFKSMEYLFVQERHYDTRFFKYWYCKRINHLQRTTAIFHAQDLFILLSNEKKQIDNYQIESDEYEYNKTTNYSIFDWEIVSRLSYERPYHCDPRRPKECSFDQIYSYFANRGFISKDFIDKLIDFFVYYFNYNGKYRGEKNIFSKRIHTCDSVILYIYFYCEEFNKNFLNMNFSYFFTRLLLMLNQVYNKNYKKDFLSKRVFEDFQNLDLQINYGEFIENLDLLHFRYKKTLIELFFNKFRNYFELDLFLQKLLLYRLKYYNDYENNEISEQYFLLAINNINNFILCVIAEFRKEISNLSIEKKKEYCELFYRNKFFLSKNPLYLHFNTFKKCKKKDEAVDKELSSFVALHQVITLSKCLNIRIEDDGSFPKENIFKKIYYTILKKILLFIVFFISTTFFKKLFLKLYNIH